MAKVGVIGVGYWGKKHVDEYTKLGHEVVAADLSRKNLEDCKNRFGCSTTMDYGIILKDRGINFVSICTPNQTHYEICMRCLEAGKHVLVEKPLAMKLEECKRLVKKAGEKNVLLVVGHIFRFNNAINKAKELLDKGELGEAELLKLSWTNMEPVFGDRDVLFDLAPHPFDIVNHLIGDDPNEISCVGGGYRQEQIEAAFINGRIGRTLIDIELSWITPAKERSMVFVGSKKTLFVDCLRQTVREYDNETKTMKDLGVVPNNTIQDELRNFIHCAKNNLVSVANGDIGIKTIRMLEICEKALREKKTVELNL